MSAHIFIGTGDAIEEDNLVEFRLLYEGELPPSGGSNTRPKEKHAIRRSFHPQLRRLWNLNRNLRELACQYALAHHSDESFPANDEEAQVQYGFAKAGEFWSRGGFKLVPLVTPPLALRCSLDISILRPEEDRFIFNQGDMDGQVKTLFDALRIPANLGETGNLGPQVDEEPFFCLLEDDRLISEVRVTTDQLLLLPNQREVKANDAHVMIHVRLNHKNARTFDNYFG
jgi:hypothetical protein